MPDSMIDRRGFLSSLTAAGAVALGAGDLRGMTARSRPNILWIVSEDNFPYLGCYGDPVARTPNLDNLAREGILFENCFSQAPVCAPSRFTLITGMYATSCAPAQHMRAQGKMPAGARGFPAYLREAGYYCTNNAKTDYNAPIELKDAWDESSRQAHWRKRPAGKPFFSVFNHEVTHESQVFPENQAKHTPLPNPTDPARVRLPAYHPDTPEMRIDRAHYYDQMARLDEQVAGLLGQLRDDGLLEDTVIFYYGDNGGVLPRSKRFCYDSGLHVPLVVRFPEKYRHLAPAPAGSRVSAPVSFVDFAPTVLHLAGVQGPAYFEGSSFVGTARVSAKKYAFSFRNRMDERYDMVRTARDERYRYIRNYMPHLVGGQHIQYMWSQTGVGVWERLYREGTLTPAQAAFWKEKPAEELYDLASDRDEVRNLADSAAHQGILERMRQALDHHLLATRDNGFIPEGSPLEGYPDSRDEGKYPLQRILPAANLVIRRNPADLSQLLTWMEDSSECMRYWAVLGCVMLRDKSAPARGKLVERLKDESAPIRVAAAEALCHLGEEARGIPLLRDLLAGHENPRVRLQAANALQNVGEKARPALDALEQAGADPDDYVRRAVRYTAAILKGEKPPREGK